MQIETNCIWCGYNITARPEHAGRRVNCPECGRRNELPRDSTQQAESAAIDEDLFVPCEAVSDAEAGPPRVDDTPLLERLLQRLLDPSSIRAMLVTGGGLTVLGTIVWLVSLGVFDDPRVVATSLVVGSLTVVGTGCVIARRTRHRLAGDAIAFLGCVLLPLNIWFLHAQSLLDIGQLWVGGLVCSIVYLATLLVLRTPLFVYAIQAGLTLTVGLLLHDLGHIRELHTLSLTLLVLGLISIHMERAFGLKGEFDRERYGLAVFRCGQVQLGSAVLLLFGTQLARWVVWPLYDLSGSPPRLAEQHMLAVGIYLTATYAYVYSDLVVRRIGVYLQLAGATCALAAFSFVLDEHVAAEVIAIVLAMLALVVNVVRGSAMLGDERLRLAARPIGLLLGLLPLVIGVTLNVRETNPWLSGSEWGYETGWPFVLAMLVTAFVAHMATVTDREVPGLVRWHTVVAALAALLGGTGLLRIAGVVDPNTQVVCLMPLAGAHLLAAVVRRGRSGEQSAYLAAMATSTALLVSLVAAMALDLVPHPLAVRGTTTNVWWIVFFTEAFALHVAASFRWHRSGNGYAAAVAALAVVWQGLAYLDVVGQGWFVPFGLLGLVMLVVGRLSSHARTHGDSPALQSGLAISILALFAAGLHGLFQLVGGSVTWGHLGWLAAQAAIGFAATIAIPAGRGWRRLVLTASLGVVAVCGMTVNVLGNLDGWDRAQLLTMAAGLVLLVHAHVLLLREREGTTFGEVPMLMTLGSLLALVPVTIAAMHGQIADGEPNWQAFVALSVAIPMLVAGISLRVRATTAVSAAALLPYLLTVVGSLAYRPQTPIGVYLAAGGVLVFVSGLFLSIHRDRIAQLPERIANREGLFAILKWR